MREPQCGRIGVSVGKLRKDSGVKPLLKTTKARPIMEEVTYSSKVQLAASSVLAPFVAMPVVLVAMPLLLAICY